MKHKTTTQIYRHILYTHINISTIHSQSLTFTLKHTHTRNEQRIGKEKMKYIKINAKAKLNYIYINEEESTHTRRHNKHIQQKDKNSQYIWICIYNSID